MVGLARPSIWYDLPYLIWKGMHLPGGASWHIEVVIMNLVPCNNRNLN